MNDLSAIEKVRSCLVAIKPNVDLDTVSDDTPLLEERVITSFDVMDLLFHLEQASGRRITRTQMIPGSFRDIRTIAQVFLNPEAEE